MTSKNELRKDARGLYLKDLVSVLEETGEDYEWSLEEIYGIGDLSILGTTMLALEDETSKSPNGIILSWHQVNSLAQCLDDLFDLKLVGRSPERASQVAIMLIDSAYWIIKGDRTILKMFESIA